MSKATINSILDGQKTIETRFSKHNIAPYGTVSVGDIVYLKPPGDEVMGQFVAKKVMYFEGMEPEDIQKIFEDWGEQIGINPKLEDDEYFQQKKDSKFGTLIWVTQSERFITSPVKIKKSDQRGWLVLD